MTMRHFRPPRNTTVTAIASSRHMLDAPLFRLRCSGSVVPAPLFRLRCSGFVVPASLFRSVRASCVASARGPLRLQAPTAAGCALLPVGAGSPVPARDRLRRALRADLRPVAVGRARGRREVPGVWRPGSRLLPFCVAYCRVYCRAYCLFYCTKVSIISRAAHSLISVSVPLPCERNTLVGRFLVDGDAEGRDPHQSFSAATRRWPPANGSGYGDQA